ncbi:hypothetical protein [Fulvivirga ligni]|uniref:hypothetical protein n=1 Tax=Fulvivirga ligni TaxID=2904246 RepID=UPI001F2567FA|nr:hypothetical protein [Fulvivirga ligni]UII20885.1 hypothetical protein LVD16_23875 [Fulvivirga ligni]
MKLLAYFILLFLTSACLAQNPKMIYRPNPKLISKEHFVDCIENLNYSVLIDPKSRREQAYFEYFPAVKKESSCEGIYYYNYVSRKHPKPKYRDTSGDTYSKYFLFIILDYKIISLTNKSQKWRQHFFNRHQKELIEKFGGNEIQELKTHIISGYKNFY